MISTHAAQNVFVTAQDTPNPNTPSPTQGASPSAQVTAVDQPPASSALQRLLADQQDLYDLADGLRGVDSRPSGIPLNPAQLASRLNEGVLVPFVGSSIAQKRDTPPSLATAITDLGLEVPRTPDELDKLTQAIKQRASVPPLGNLGGALSWPIPMSHADQIKLGVFLRSPNKSFPDFPLQFDKNTLSYLLSGSSVTADDLKDPVKALHKLLDSPKAQALGLTIQTHFNGIATDTSVYDYLLAALNIGFNLSNNDAPKRNTVAFFHLERSDSLGKKPGEVVEDLKNWLVQISRATSTTAPLAARLLLAASAPQFLVKDIPPSVTVGSIVWGQLTIAVAKIEAQTPGRVANMTYAEVIAAAESLSADDDTVRSAERGVLIDWGAANGLLGDDWRKPRDSQSEQQIEQLRAAYNSQLQALKSHSTSIYEPIPDREKIALNHLKAEFPEVDPQVFKAKVLRKQLTIEGRTGAGDPRPRSMLDVVMEGEKLGGSMRWISSDASVPISAFSDFAQSDKVDVPSEFDTQYQRAINDKKEGHAGMVKYLISNLPLNDRKDFEFGKLEYFYNNDYKVENGSNVIVNRERTLYVKTTRAGQSNLYEIDTSAGTIKKHNDRLATLLAPVYYPKAVGQTEQTFSQLRSYHPFTQSPAPDSAETRDTGLTPKSYESTRTKNIADFYVNALRLDDESLRNQFNGVTSFDHDRSGDTLIKEFLLNLIPFRSAIVNIRDGKYGEATTDLALDLVGLVTLGAGKAVQAANALSKGVKTLSAGAKTVKALKFLGGAAIEALNPLGGAGDLLRRLGKAGEFAVNKLKGATGSYDLLKAASKEYGVMATGTYKVGHHAFEAGAILHEGKWYAYDPVSARPYGPPLPMFTADSVAMGGVMQSFRILNNGLGMSEDVTKRGLRLTLDAHGVIPEGSRSALMAVDGQHISAYGLVDQLKTSGVDLSKYSEIRLTMCDSGTGGEQSFAATLARLTHKPVEGFKGVMYTSTEVEDVAARMFKNGGAKQREFIDETVNGQKKTITKFKLTGVDSEHRGVYTHHPDYNPVRFDAEGRLLETKPLRQSHTADKADVNNNEIADSKVDFDDYDDLT